MSSKSELLNKNLIISYERQLYSKMNLDIDLEQQNNAKIFESLLNNYSQNNINLLYFMNKLLPNISTFNDICLKYFTSLIDSFKYYMNKNMNKNKKEINNYQIILILNSIANFIKIFSKNQEKYNEKHKNILKQFPLFLQLFFKLFQQKYDIINLNFDNEYKIIEAFFILCLAFVEYYPTLLRNYQNTIEKYIKSIFYHYIVENNINQKTVNTAIVLYDNLYKLSPNIVNRHQDYVLNIINNIKYYIEYFKPKSIENEENNKSNKIILEKKNNVLFIENDKNKYENIDNKNIIHADKTIEILFKLLNNIFKYMPNNIYFDIDFNIIFSLFNDVLNIYESFDNNNNKSKSSLLMIIINGLSKKNYELFIINTNEKILDILIYLITNFSKYIYCYNIFFSKYINKILLNQNFLKIRINTFNLHIKTLTFFRVVISYFNHILPEEIDLIIYKHLYNNLPMLYLKYLQQNDKTILKVDEIYFKSSVIKNKIYSYESNNMSDNSDNLSPNDNHILLLEYLKLLFDYCVTVKNISQLNYINILGGIIDLIILPPYAKFIFNIDNDIKKIIIDIIEICIKRNLIYINKQKLINFLNNFYFFDGNLKYNAEIIINLIQIQDNKLLIENNYDNNNNNYYGGIPNNITDQVYDFNIKIKEFLNDFHKKMEEIQLIYNENNENKKDKKEENIIDENINNDIHNDMINKKRKNKINQKIEIDNEEESDNDNDIKYERKGNKEKNIKIKKIENNNIINIIEQEQKIQDLKIYEENNKNNIEKKNDNKEEEDIQFDEDIDIPDII